MAWWSPEPRERHRRWPARRDLGLTAEAFVLALSAPVVCRLSLDQQTALLNRGRRRDRLGRLAPRPRSADEVLRVTDAVLRRGRPLVRTGCLTRAVTRYWCLERTGNDVELCFGVARIDGRVEGHCWVRSPEGPFREPDDADCFREIFRIGPDGLREVTAS